MIVSLEIKGLRGIREGRIEGLRALTIFVGPNGCGKSTVLEAAGVVCAGGNAERAFAAVAGREWLGLAGMAYWCEPKAGLFLSARFEPALRPGRGELATRKSRAYFVSGRRPTLSLSVRLARGAREETSRRSSYRRRSRTSFRLRDQGRDAPSQKRSSTTTGSAPPSRPGKSWPPSKHSEPAPTAAPAPERASNPPVSPALFATPSR